MSESRLAISPVAALCAIIKARRSSFIIQRVNISRGESLGTPSASVGLLRILSVVGGVSAVENSEHTSF